MVLTKNIFKEAFCDILLLLETILYVSAMYTMPQCYNTILVSVPLYVSSINDFDDMVHTTLAGTDRHWTAAAHWQAQSRARACQASA